MTSSALRPEVDRGRSVLAEGFNPQKSRHPTLRCLDAQLCCLCTISLLTVHCSLSRYMRSGALIPISDSVRASTICAADTSFSRAIESASSSESTRHFS